MTTLKTLKTIALRAPDTLLHDAIGAAALIMMFVVALHLPQLI